MRLNYRNTAEVLAVAYEFARDVITPHDADEDGIPVLSPQSAGRHGRTPELVRLPSFQHEADYVAERLREFHASGVAWNDMAVLYRVNFMGERLAAALASASIPAELVGRGSGSKPYNPTHDSVKILTMHSSKGLEFPVAIVSGVGYMPHERDEPCEEARLLYVAMTRAMDSLVVTCHRESPFTKKIADVLRRVA